MGIIATKISRKAPRQAVREEVRSQKDQTQAPYGLDLSESCAACKYRRSGFFCQFSQAELRDFDAVKSLAVYPAGTLLFLEQEEPKGIYVLCEGEVKLSFSSREGKALLLRIAKHGEVLGLLSALTGNPYEVTAQALRSCQFAFASVEDFRKFLQRHPHLFRVIADEMGLQYKSACEQLCAIGLGASILERVAHFLLTWSADKGAPNDGLQFTLPLSHEEIGECVGTTRESVTRALGEFRSRGLIASRGATWLIRDRAALKAAGRRPTTPNNVRPELVRLSPRVRYSIAPHVPGPFWKRAENGRKSA
jgi:CRP/FNR family transcriptional regulator, cyclic AMP receptor protein